MEVMEVEIDPLSMLEQSMHVNDYSITCDGDQDVVCLSDGSEDQVQELPRMAAYAPIDANTPSILLGTMPNGAVFLNPSVNEMTYIMEPLQTMQEEVVDNQLDGGHFLGEHFMFDPGPSTSNANSTDSSIPTTFIGEKHSVRGRGYHKVTRGTGTNRGRRGRGTMHNGVVKQRNNVKVTNTPPANTTNHNNNKVVDHEALINSKLFANVRKLAYISSDEQAYRSRMYKDFQRVVDSKLDCTICGAHIGCKKNLDVSSITHPLLKVLTCCNCRGQYCCTDWKLAKDGSDMRCRWCASSGSIYRLLKFCKNCPFAFCESCISRNYPRGECSRIMKNVNWNCFVCQMVPLYYLRATLWALSQYINSINKKKDSEPNGQDHSSCHPEIDLTNCIEDDEETESEDEVMQVSCVSVMTRMDVLFKSIEDIRQEVKMRLSEPVEASRLHDLVTAVSFSLSKIGRNVDSGLEYIENWRLHVSELHRKELARKSDEKRKKLVVRTKNGDCGYEDLFRKFNIKPCSVVLERMDSWQETSRPPDFFISLVEPSKEKTTESEIIDVDEDDDDDDVILVEN